MHKTLLACLIPLTLAGCASAPPPVNTAALTDDARKTAGQLMQRMGGELKSILGSQGPVESITVCKDLAPKIGGEISKSSGFAIRRVSDKNRNPKAVPDAWEAQALAEMEKRLAGGEKPDTLEVSAVVDGPNGKVFRYAKGVVMQSVCMMCHGTTETLEPAVKTRVDAIYPGDKAVGYRVGQLRGAITMQKPL
jgi:hypothetical protein